MLELNKLPQKYKMTTRYLVLAFLLLLLIAVSAQYSLHYNSHAKRSSAVRSSFMRSHPCPSTGETSGACPGYVVDHIKALKRGGADSPSNMQWQTVEAAKQKDKWE